MVSGCVPRLLLLLLLASSPPALLADDCHPTTVSSVRLSASSYRNLTGHWFTKAVLIRKSTSDVSKLQTEERSLHYDVDITRQGCGDDEILTTVFSIIAPPARVGADYKFFPGIGYYKLHTEKLNWENARRSCAKEGAHLAIVNSEAEANAIGEVMRSYSKEKFPAFIGFHDMFKEGEFVTIFGEPLISTGHVRWAKGEPNNRKLEGSPEDEDCGDINPDGTINDNMCSKEMLFVCEQDL